MKRKISILLMCVLLISAMQPLFASKFVENETVSLKDGNSQKTSDYTPINLMMGGEDVYTDVPAILYELNGAARTLVPIRVISEGLGADVSWDGIKQVVTLTYKGKVIKLTIDSASATVNGKSYKLPDNVPAKLMVYQGVTRTLVPVRFVTEQFGLDVGWVADTKTALLNKAKQKVTDITYGYNGGYQEIIVHTSGPVDASSFYLDGGSVGVSNKLVVDIANAEFAFKHKTALDAKGTSYLGIYDQNLSSVRGAQFETTPMPITRVVVDMDARRGYDIIKENNQIRIRFINSVKDIRQEKIMSAHAIVIKTGEAPAYNVSTWDGKVIVDVINSEMKFTHELGTTIPVGKGGITSYSFSQLDPTAFYGADAIVSRVVVKLDDPKMLDNIYVEEVENEIYVYVSETPLNNFIYGKDTVATSSITLSLSKEGQYQTQFDPSTNTFEVRLPQTLSHLTDFSMSPNDNVVKSIALTTVGQEYVVSVKLYDGAVPHDPGKGQAKENLVLSFHNASLETLDFEGQLVVIDAGHGGKDPGAVSPIDKTYEKTIVLSVALKLQKQLESLGFKVYMTRDYDTYVGLYDRASIANELGADVFVSLHTNAATNASAKGVEMLYVNDHRGSDVFARIMQDELVKATGAYNRGALERSKLVVIRETHMPAVLAEIGFLTNEQELKLLKTEAHQDKIVQGLLKGIMDYLK